MVRSKRLLSPLIKVKDALTRERRKNRRLRAVIDALAERIAANRRDLDLQFTRLAQLQAEVDGLKSSANAAQKSGSPLSP
jgi:cell division septum initiation protein DivIVA